MNQKMLQASYPKSPFMKNSLVESQLMKGNPQLLEKLLAWLAETPTVTTYRVNLLRTTCQSFQHKIVDQLLMPKYGTNLPKVFTLPDLPEVVCIDRLKSLNQPPTVSSEQLKQVIVDASCGASLLRGAHIYARGVLAMETGTRCNDQVLVYADVEGKCKRGTNVCYESEHKLFIGVGLVRMQRHQLYGENPAPSGIAVEMLRVRSGVPSLGNIAGTEALLQNLPSIVCVRALNPQPDETILDMCAAPGNKTTHIAEMMQDEGVIIALDKTKARVGLVEFAAANLNHRSIKCHAFDSTMAYLQNAERDKFEPPFAEATFDRILLDAPCSGLGNRPLLTLSLTPKVLESFPNIQRKLLRNAIPLLKPRGTLIYSTCTVTEEENEGMVAWVLRKYPELQLVEALPRYGGFGLENAGLTQEQRMLVQRFGPTNHRETFAVDTVGFFIAKFIKQPM